MYLLLSFALRHAFAGVKYLFMCIIHNDIVKLLTRLDTSFVQILQSKAESFHYN